MFLIQFVSIAQSCASFVSSKCVCITVRPADALRSPLTFCVSRRPGAVVVMLFTVKIQRAGLAIRGSCMRRSSPAISFGRRLNPKNQPAPFGIKVRSSAKKRLRFIKVHHSSVSAALANLALVQTGLTARRTAHVGAKPLPASLPPHERPMPSGVSAAAQCAFSSASPNFLRSSLISSKALVAP